MKFRFRIPGWEVLLWKRSKKEIPYKHSGYERSWEDESASRCRPCVQRCGNIDCYGTFPGRADCDKGEIERQES